MIWSRPMVIRLEQLWRSPVGISKIGHILSAEFNCPISRNAVVSKAGRLELNKLYPREVPKSLQNRKKNGKRRPASQRPSIITHFFQPKERAPEKLAEDAIIPPGHHIFSDETRCLWPQVDAEKDPIRCTEPRAEGWPYCDCHVRRAYVSFGTEYRPAMVKYLSASGALKT